MHYLIGTVLILTLLVACGSRGYFDCPETKIIFQIIQKNNRQLARIGLYERMNGGGGQPITNLISEGYATQSYRFSSVEEARIFICNVFEAFVKPLNEEEKVRPLVQNFPLTAKNFHFFIHFVDQNGITLQPPLISSIDIRDGKIWYFVDKEDARSSLIHSEPYEEAKKICLPL